MVVAETYFATIAVVPNPSESAPAFGLVERTSRIFGRSPWIDPIVYTENPTQNGFAGRTHIRVLEV
jgi:hypothetical protein